MSDADWESKTVIGYKAKAPKVTRNTSDLNGQSVQFLSVSTEADQPIVRFCSCAVVATEKKVTAATNKAHQGTDHQRIAKLDRENEVAPPPKIAPSVGKAMQTARMDKQLSQKDVAQKINEKPSVLQDYEAGRAIPNPQILAKLERVLGVKLRGADIGKKLGGPKAP
ncbi:Multiprotein-bridging factor 1 [Sparassis crispa]|uniref:Multiprotein-bridging factor 1 n=1 Tax=Sparassis crispa TaxID=139825 RepID=A0A401GJS1_9APHY|nr:Multiprotein-bridging factor 1 [Sparassis crispa]GBE82402.1 Multiprotein-bridging factor 1 [Sparassis crispa]